MLYQMGPIIFFSLLSKMSKKGVMLLQVLLYMVYKLMCHRSHKLSQKTHLLSYRSATNHIHWNINL